MCPIGPAESQTLPTALPSRRLIHGQHPGPPESSASRPPTASATLPQRAPVRHQFHQPLSTVCSRFPRHPLQPLVQPHSKYPRFLGVSHGLRNRRRTTTSGSRPKVHSPEVIIFPFFQSPFSFFQNPLPLMSTLSCVSCPESVSFPVSNSCSFCFPDSTPAFHFCSTCSFPGFCFSVCSCVCFF